MTKLYYSSKIFLNVLEILAGLLIIGTIIKKHKTIKTITTGSYLIIIAATMIITQNLLEMVKPLGEYAEVMETTIFLLIAIGIGSLKSSKRSARKKTLK